MEIFRKSIEARWSDIDLNRHVSNSAYGAFATHLRSSWLDSIGFPLTKLISLGYTAMSLKEETEYFRQVYLGESIEAVVSVNAASIDWSRWQFITKFYRQNKKIVAAHVVNGVWVNIATQKISSPPPEFLQTVDAIAKDATFERIIVDSRRQHRTT
ncbi:MAG: hypothetical protein RL017_353 [Pseudomonadota bacterium]|jgi:acyl-CoA thioester hydrolase|nr:thioesterase family protein [Burkholderiales bacterium]